MLDGLLHPHNSMPYVQMSRNIGLGQMLHEQGYSSVRSSISLISPNISLISPNISLIYP